MVDQSTKRNSQRIAKVLARAGLCSRREAERWIVDGRVRLNGQVLTTPAVNISEGDMILVDGKPLPDAEKTRLWRYHKPPGLVTTNRDPQNRPTIFDRLPHELPRVITVGRLDITSEGLLLLTNDGELSRRLELPKTAWTRHYRVRVHGRVDKDTLAQLANGVSIDGVHYASINAALEIQQKSNAWLDVKLKEGKNREVRRVMEHMGLVVTRLIRTAYGPFQLGNMPRGRVDEITGKVMREQVSGLAKPPSQLGHQ